MNHLSIASFFVVMLFKGIKVTWRTRNDPNTRRGHFAQHSVSAVGRRDGRSVGQILRSLAPERESPLSLWRGHPRPGSPVAYRMVTR